MRTSDRFGRGRSERYITISPLRIRWHDFLLSYGVLGRSDFEL